MEIHFVVLVLHYTFESRLMQGECSHYRLKHMTDWNSSVFSKKKMLNYLVLMLFYSRCCMIEKILQILVQNFAINKNLGSTPGGALRPIISPQTVPITSGVGTG